MEWPRLTATQSEVAATDVAPGGSSAGNLTAGSAFPWRCQTLKHATGQTLQNALPAVDCQRCCLQVDTSAVADDSGSSFNPIFRTLASLQTLDRSISPSLPKLAAMNRLESSDVLVMAVHIVTSAQIQDVSAPKLSPRRGSPMSAQGGANASTASICATLGNHPTHTDSPNGAALTRTRSVALFNLKRKVRRLCGHDLACNGSEWQGNQGRSSGPGRCKHIARIRERDHEATGAGAWCCRRCGRSPWPTIGTLCSPSVRVTPSGLSCGQLSHPQGCANARTARVYSTLG